MHSKKTQEISLLIDLIVSTTDDLIIIITLADTEQFCTFNCWVIFEIKYTKTLSLKISLINKEMTTKNVIERKPMVMAKISHVLLPRSSSCECCECVMRQNNRFILLEKSTYQDKIQFQLNNDAILITNIYPEIQSDLLCKSSVDKAAYTI